MTRAIYKFSKGMNKTLVKIGHHTQNIIYRHAYRELLRSPTLTTGRTVIALKYSPTVQTCSVYFAAMVFCESMMPFYPSIIERAYYVLKSHTFFVYLEPRQYL